MAARYSVYPPIPAAEYYSALMQAYLDQLQVDLRRQWQQQRSQSTQDEANQAESFVTVQEISPSSRSTTADSASSSSRDDEEAVTSDLTEDEAEKDRSTSIVVSMLAELGIYVSDDEI
ncbi:hypothetical protein CIPAW_13G099100 [Carya illinoinensis]|uniref:Uncharacterized protein n=1 Tax=Carya illinoinensis TaxID=32201 RepID=A0A8T1NMF9_CARIL|nr:hypothetical protein CIPAW_13G099100 [Carya illinoinensis]